MRRITDSRRKNGGGKSSAAIVFITIGIILAVVMIFAFIGNTGKKKIHETEPHQTRSETAAGKSEAGSSQNTTATSAAATTSMAATATTTAATTTSAATTTTTEAATTTTTTEETLSTVVDSNRSMLGSGAELSGKIIVVTIFASDTQGSWDFSDKHDKELRKSAWTDLYVATDWIEKSAADYGRYVDFIWDYEVYKDLKYEASFQIDAFETLYSPSYEPFYECIDQIVPTNDLMKKYKADGIVYFMFFDGIYRSDKRSCSRPYYGHPDYNYEISFINMNRGDHETRPASVAHEMLHLFGAPDLYFPNSHNTGITQEYVDYVADTGLNDIMRIVYDPKTKTEYSDRIVNEITDITAYYVGLTDYSETVDEWGFAPSEHAA